MEFQDPRIFSGPSFIEIQYGCHRAGKFEKIKKRVEISKFLNNRFKKYKVFKIILRNLNIFKISYNIFILELLKIFRYMYMYKKKCLVTEKIFKYKKKRLNTGFLKLVFFELKNSLIYMES